MAEILEWVGECLRVLVASIFALTPGIVFWLVVIGVVAIVQRWSPRRSVSDRTG